MANRAQTLLRCGWLYRVLQPGTVREGDTMALLERPCPEWTVARVMYYLFLERENVEMMKQIVALPALGEEIREKFQKRLDKGTAEDQTWRMYGDGRERMESWDMCKVIEKRRETSRVVALVLEILDQDRQREETPIEPGSHVRVKLGGKLVRAYSVVGGNTRRFELGIALDPSSRGGSKFLHVINRRHLASETQE